MSMPFYVSPEQQMRDRAEYARKGIARGRSAVAMQYADGILFVAENRSPALHKVAEIYDRIGFAAVGRYNQFENLRIAGVRLADTRGYSYARRDVTGRALANAYAQTLGSIFSSPGELPVEVEIIVAEVGASADEDQIYRLTFDGSIADERGYAAMGGSADQVSDYIAEHYSEGVSLSGALRLAVDALGHDGGSEPRHLEPDQIEVAVLDRTRTQQRKFKRIAKDTLTRMLAESAPPPEPAPGPAPAEGDSGTPEAQPGTAESAPPATPPSAQDEAPAAPPQDDAPVAPPEDDAPVAPPADPDDRPL